MTSVSTVLRVLVFTIIGVLTVGCQVAPLDVYYQSKSPERLSSLSSFEVHAHAAKKGPYLDLLTEAVTDLMSDKGYALSEEADILVVYQIRLNESSEFRVENYPIGDKVYSHQLLEAVYEGTILINAIERSTGEVLWKASTTRDLTQVDTKKFDSERAHKAIYEIFESFPAREL